MKVNELEKVALTADDISKMFGVSKSTAYKISQNARAESDRLHLRGRVHVDDVKAYLKRSRRTQWQHSTKSY